MPSYPIDPVAKPRMTRLDKWKKRPCVMRYWAFKDEVEKLKLQLPEAGAHIRFYISMPKSWSNKKRAEMLGKPHQEKPDLDNLLKALCDALYESDAHIHDVRVTKIWSNSGCICIE